MVVIILTGGDSSVIICNESNVDSWCISTVTFDNNVTINGVTLHIDTTGADHSILSPLVSDIVLVLAT